MLYPCISSQRVLSLLSAVCVLACVACNDSDPGTVPGQDPDLPETTPSVALSKGEVFSNSFSFTVTPSNAAFCAFTYVEDGENLPSAKDILAGGGTPSPLTNRA